MPHSLKQYLTWIDSDIKKQEYGSEPASLYEPIRYIMALGGKRIRPLLTLLAYSLYRKDVQSAVPYAVAVEAFHNFTLMHDDIMDKAPLRRGNATVHKKWNTNTAILSGDVMLVKVYGMFLKLEPARAIPVLKLFNQCAAEVCEGQQFDMEFEGRDDVSEEEYIGMIRLKTAVLLGFSLELGAVLAGAPQKDRRALREFGINIGIGFQLKDDLLDAYADPGKFGKQVGGDILANKKTYLLISALRNARGSQKKELLSWIGAKRFKKREKIEGVKSIFDALGVPLLAEQRINHYFRKGFRNLEKIAADHGRIQLLRQFTEQLIGRQS